MYPYQMKRHLLTVLSLIAASSKCRGGTRAQEEHGEEDVNVIEARLRREDVNASSSSSSSITTIRKQPKIYTYFDRIEYNTELVTGMSPENHIELLDLWATTWNEYGWDPVVLDRTTVERHSGYPDFRNKLSRLKLDDFGEILFHRWFAMVAVGGGWFADYDVFPIVSSEKIDDDEFSRIHVMTVFDIAAPSLAAGNSQHWNQILNLLLEDALEYTAMKTEQPGPDDIVPAFHFWTDALGILNLLRDYKLKSIKSERRVATPYGAKDPIFSDAGCNSKPFRGRWAVHVGPQVMQSAPHVPPAKRHPKFRAELAKEWLEQWKSKCRSIQ